MIIKQVAVGPIQNFVYIIADEKNKTAAVVDAGFDAEKIVNEADKLQVKIDKILITHTHPDHIGAVESLVRLTGAEVFAHKMVTMFDAQSLDEGSIVEIGDIKVKVLCTPGHTPEGIVFQVENNLFTGDTLFVEGCGRTDLGGGNTEHMWKSLQRLKSMPDNYEVFPGHDYGSIPHSTIAHEKKHNRFFLSSNEEAFTAERL